MSSCDFVSLTKFHRKPETKRECRLFKRERMSWFATSLLSLIFAVEWGRKTKNQSTSDWFVGILVKSPSKKRETGFGPATFSLARRRTTTVLLPQIHPHYSAQRTPVKLFSGACPTAKTVRPLKRLQTCPSARLLPASCFLCSLAPSLPVPSEG